MKYLKLILISTIFTFTVSCGQQNRFIQYKVKEGESMSIIAEKLNMKTGDLLRLNPDFTETPKPNSFIIVPENKYDLFENKEKKHGVVIEEIDTISKNTIISEKELLLESLKENFLVIEIKKGDTFYSLEKKYQVSRGELLLLNPELKEGLKVGMLLKIKELPKPIIDEGIYYNDFINPNTALKVAMLLPFRSDLYNNDTITPSTIFQKNASLVSITTDFYLGAELAIDSLRKKGIDINLDIFDTGARKNNGVRKIIAEQNLSKNDVIIGPFYSEEVQLVAANSNVPVVFPLYSSNQSEFQHSNIIKISPDKKVFKEVMIHYIKSHLEGGNLLIIGNDFSETNSLKNELMQEHTTATISIMTPTNGFISKGQFLQTFKPDAKNWVLLASSNEVVVSDVINSLMSLPEQTAVSVFSFDKGNLYDKIDNAKLAKIGFTYVSEEFTDESSASSALFTKMYLKKNQTLPSFYATKGFDITYDILLRLASGKRLSETFMEGTSKRVDTKFDYTDSLSSENKGVFILKINKDLTLSNLY